MIEYDINSEQRITGEIGGGDMTADISVGGVVYIHTGDVYDGATEVIPKANERTVLETAEKIVLRDITVFEVPYFQVSNPQGGNTAYIATNTEVN